MGAASRWKLRKKDPAEPPAPLLRPAAVDRDRRQPGGQRCAPAEAAPVLVGGEEHVLDDVLDVGAALPAQQSVGEPGDPGLVSLDDRFECTGLVRGERLDKGIGRPAATGSAARAGVPRLASASASAVPAVISVAFHCPGFQQP